MGARSSDDRCSLRSLAADEPLSATASTIRRWLLIEHLGPWGRDGLTDARLPQGVGQALRSLEERSGTRVLLIRKPDRHREVDEGVYLCSVDTRDAWMGWQVVDRIEDVLDLDPGDRERFFDPEGEPLFVTCTHGRRDTCCAERGRPLAEAIDAVAWTVAWESTHVGGDRFAANLVAFPHGLYFGRVDPEEGPGIVRAYAEGRIVPLDRYRGRSCHPRHVQAAERALRGLLSNDRIDDLRLVDQVRRGDAGEVTFDTPRGEVRVTLERIAGAPLRLTCRSTREESPVSWRATAIEPAGT